MDNYLKFNTEEHLDALRNHLIFSGLSDEEIITFLNHAKPEHKHFSAGESIHIEPGFRHRMGIVLSGNLLVFSIDYDGSKTLINSVQGSGFIGTMQFVLDYYNTVFEITATLDSDIILFMPESLLIADRETALIQHKILVNFIASQRHLFFSLSEHIACLSRKNVRDKILRFLKIYSDRVRSYEFDIPFSREELAAYLAVDRASLSRSLGDLRREGIIEFRREHFKILTTRHFIY